MPGDSPLTQSEHNVIESYIDKYGLTDVILSLAEICQEKALHVAENQSDPPPAKAWARDAEALEQAAEWKP